jgi:CheY-like chemotaxis protein
MNACEAMPGGGLIQVSAENITVTADNGLPLEEGDYVKITVKDHGPGIPEDILPYIFDPYFTTKAEGSGLGLAAAYSIVKSHGGIITVESDLGAGAAFSVYLPAAGKWNEENQTQENEPMRCRGKILFMDDEEPIRDLACEMLSMLGYETAPARNGAEAVELYAAAKEAGATFDAVVLDLTVPGGMGGKETIQRLLSIDPEVAGIVSSGYSNDPIMADYRKYGFRSIIPKPYSATQLGEVLKEALGRKPAPHRTSGTS